MIEIFRRIRPDLPKYNPDGSIFTLSAYVENPLTTYYNTKMSTGENLSGIAELEWTIMKGLIFSTRASVNYSSSEYLSYDRRGSEHNTTGERNWSRTKSDTKIWDNTLVYANTFGKHDISASLTSSMERYQRVYFGMSASNFPDDDVLNSFTDAADIDGIGETFQENSLISQIARAQYKYGERYLATFTMRRDGSSKFGPGKRWGLFPSGGIGWLVSEEKFMKKGWLGDNITHMKLRASYGKSGSQNLSDYQWMTMVSSGVYMESPAIYPSNIGNNNLQWEETYMTDLALELEMWDSRFRTTIGYFKKESDNLIYRQYLPYSSAFSYMYSNIAATEGHGFEFNVDVDVIRNSKWQLTLNANGSKNKSKIIRFNNELTEYFPSHSKISLEDGGVIGNWYGYRSYQRLFGTSEEATALKTRDQDGTIVEYLNTLEGAGDIYMEDINGDGVIDTDDKTYLGSSIPKLFGGFGMTLYIGRSFRLGATFTYSYGNKRLWYMAAESTSGINNYNFSNKFAGTSAHVQSPFLDTTYPRISIGSNGASYMSDYWLFDASYIRLSSLNMSYRLGKEYFRNSLIENIEITLQATNLFTLTKYPGFDPQGNFYEGSSSMTSNMGIDWSYYPASRSINLGFKFTFK